MDFVIICQFSGLILMMKRIKTLWSDISIKFQPLLTWTVCLFSCFFGEFSVKLLSADDAISVFENAPAIKKATFVWWLTFYSPFRQYTYLLDQPLPAFLPIVFSEYYRSFRVQQYVYHGLAQYPNSQYIPVIFAFFGSCSTEMIVNYFKSRSYNCHQHGKRPLLYSISIKLCLIFAFLHTITFNLDHNSIIICQTVFLVSYSMLDLLHIQFDPFTFIECFVFAVAINIPDQLWFRLVNTWKKRYSQTLSCQSSHTSF